MQRFLQIKLEIPIKKKRHFYFVLFANRINLINWLIKSQTHSPLPKNLVMQNIKEIYSSAM